eukprot:3365173-Pyramimonas_sp.AAC.1
MQDAEDNRILFHRMRQFQKSLLSTASPTSFPRRWSLPPFDFMQKLAHPLKELNQHCMDNFMWLWDNYDNAKSAWR